MDPAAREAGFPVVSERLGHADVGITLDTHSQILPALQEAAALRLDEALVMPPAHPEAVSVEPLMASP